MASNNSHYSTFRNHFNKCNNINALENDTLELVGTIIKEPFITKNGKPVPGLFDYYFKTEKEKYFIKVNESIFSKEKLEDMMTKDSIPEAEFHNRKFKVILSNGDWDNDPENPEMQQSRVGQYIIIIQELVQVRKIPHGKIYTEQEMLAIQLGDSTAKAELKKYSALNPNMISAGQLSLDFYDKNVEYMAKNINALEVSYKFNQPIGGKVMYPEFSVVVNVDTKETTFIKGK